MKAKLLKQIVPIVTLSIFAMGSPLMVQAQEGYTSREVRTEVNEPAGADDEGMNWSWLGLLGLLGLFGLKRTREVHDQEYRTGPARA